MKSTGFLGNSRKIALAMALVTGPVPNITCGNQWIVQVQPNLEPTQSLQQADRQSGWTIERMSFRQQNTSKPPAQTEPQNKGEQPRAPRRASPIDTIRKHMQRLGYSIDESKSKPEMIVSNYSDPKKGKVTIVMIYDKRKEVVGFYIYKFGNMDKAVDPSALEKYLLSTNDAIIIGGFFVDKDGDIGYKYVSAASQLSLGSFEVIYVTMATVALDRRPEIRKLMETGKKEEG